MEPFPEDPAPVTGGEEERKKKHRANRHRGGVKNREKRERKAAEEAAAASGDPSLSSSSPLFSPTALISSPTLNAPPSSTALTPSGGSFTNTNTTTARLFDLPTATQEVFGIVEQISDMKMEHERLNNRILALEAQNEDTAKHLSYTEEKHAKLQRVHKEINEKFRVEQTDLRKARKEFTHLEKELEAEKEETKRAHARIQALETSLANAKTSLASEKRSNQAQADDKLRLEEQLTDAFKDATGILNQSKGKDDEIKELRKEIAEHIAAKKEQQQEFVEQAALLANIQEDLEKAQSEAQPFDPSIDAFPELNASKDAMTPPRPVTAAGHMRSLGDELSMFEDIEGFDGEVIDFTQFIGGFQQTEPIAPSTAALPVQRSRSSQTPSLIQESQGSQTPTLIQQSHGSQTASAIQRSQGSQTPILIQQSQGSQTASADQRSRGSQTFSTLKRSRGSQTASPEVINLSQVFGASQSITPSAETPAVLTETTEPRIIYVDRPSTIFNHNAFLCWLQVDIDFWYLIGVIIMAALENYLSNEPSSSLDDTSSFAGPSTGPLLQAGDNDDSEGQTSDSFGDPEEKDETDSAPVRQSPTNQDGRSNHLGLSQVSGDVSGRSARNHARSSSPKDAHNKFASEQNRKANFWRIFFTYLLHVCIYLFFFSAYRTIGYREMWLQANESTRSYIASFFVGRSSSYRSGMFSLRFWMSEYWAMTLLRAAQFITQYQAKSNRIPG